MNFSKSSPPNEFPYENDEDASVPRAHIKNITVISSKRNSIASLNWISFSWETGETLVIQTSVSILEQPDSIRFLQGEKKKKKTKLISIEISAEFHDFRREKLVSSSSSFFLKETIFY